MKKMSREEKILAISDMLMHFDNYLINAETIRRAAIIYDAIEPPEIKAGMWGKFWDIVCPAVYGKLQYVETGSTHKYRMSAGAFQFFQPMTPEEIAKDIRKQKKEENEY